MQPSGGKVKVGDKEVLVELIPPPAPPNNLHDDQASPVIQPPPPATPTDPGKFVIITKSLNQTVKVGTRRIVTQGTLMQGTVPTWPGLVQSSQNNASVKINGTPINVVGDKGIVTVTGGMVSFSKSGQEA
ncbi:MAG TPA: hypothetical protein PLD20_07335 [Blastocatellia bacterium]|nr:hypothetical protein [Blastocatellia bacterium]HMY75406.1 hypothetical protein [Blastocatellia bacterium]HMZ17724.1 hypothetical protein [Blastocatellia bacterium]HNG33989.1 hypothetical protein [Blastocatellia bacterium]